jgi:hypothetical protein
MAAFGRLGYGTVGNPATQFDQRMATINQLRLIKSFVFHHYYH